ncbi:hypothetical protein RFI_29597, partial [Reticulomyxa filosa]
MPEPLFILRHHTDEISVVNFLIGLPKFKKEPILVSGDVGGCVKLWDLETRRPLHSFNPCEAKKGAILNVTNTVSHDYMITQSRSPMSGMIKIWDLNKLGNQSGTEKGTGTVREFDSKCTTFCKCSVMEPCILTEKNDKSKEIGHNLILCCVNEDKSNVDVWDIRSFQKLRAINIAKISEEKRGMIMSIQAYSIVRGDVSADKSQMILWLASESGHVDLYDVTNDKMLASHKFGKF